MTTLYGIKNTRFFPRSARGHITWYPTRAARRRGLTALAAQARAYGLSDPTLWPTTERRIRTANQKRWAIRLQESGVLLPNGLDLPTTSLADVYCLDNGEGTHHD